MPFSPEQIRNGEDEIFQLAKKLHIATKDATAKELSRAIRRLAKELASELYYAKKAVKRLDYFEKKKREQQP